MSLNYRSTHFSCEE